MEASLRHNGLYVSVMAYGAKAEEAIEQAIAEMRRLDSLLSAYDPDSEVSAINRMAGKPRSRFQMIPWR